MVSDWRQYNKNVRQRLSIFYLLMGRRTRLWIRNGYNSFFDSGGIDYIYDSILTIKNSVISDNHNDGIRTNRGSILILNSTISGNSIGVVADYEDSAITIDIYTDVAYTHGSGTLAVATNRR